MSRQTGSHLRSLCNGVLTLALALPVLANSPVAGIENFHQVDAHVYRGAQPTEEGFQYLAKVGVKTVIDLREADGRSRKEEQMVTAAGMKYINVPMSGLTPPSQAEIGRILEILENDAAGGVFVHCKRGADRTGAVIASYRIDHNGWDNGRALSEAMSDGMSFFQLPRQNYIRTFQARKIEAKASPADTPQTVPAPAVAQ
jgi:tyrosine-protein phosphatase SIW14